MKFLSWIILLPLAFVLIIFSVSNRGSVPIDLWPLPYGIEIPLYILLIATLLVGVLWGGVSTWMRAGQTRRAGRLKAQENRTLSSEITLLKKQVENLKAEIKLSQTIVSRETISQSENVEPLKLENKSK